jgi:hypothetical protein
MKIMFNLLYRDTSVSVQEVKHYLHMDSCYCSRGQIIVSLYKRHDLLNITSCLVFFVQVSAQLSCEIHTTQSGRPLYNKMLHLVQRHYDLASTTVTGIPMKVMFNLLYRDTSISQDN